MQSLKIFAFGYLSVACMFATWTLTIMTGQFDKLALAIIIGNIFLLGSTFFLIDFILPPIRWKHIIAIILGLQIAVPFLWWRITYFFPHPTYANGILFLNTAPLVTILLTIIFVFLWIPSNLKMARVLAETLNNSAYFYYYGALFIGAVGFAVLLMSAKSVTMIIVASCGIMICFLLLLLSNIILFSKLPNNKDKDIAPPSSNQPLI